MCTHVCYEMLLILHVCVVHVCRCLSCVVCMLEMCWASCTCVCVQACCVCYASGMKCRGMCCACVLGVRAHLCPASDVH